MKRAFAALLAGTVFGMGLGESGMVDPRKVLGFLDVLGRWDPGLMLVMAGAVAVYAAGRRLLLWRGRPWLATDFQLPAGTRIDARLLFGAALFGVGWGLGGYCPGPALAGLGLANADMLTLLPAMLAGWWLAARRPAR